MKEQYVVEKILDKRMRRNKVEYLLQWEGYGEEENTWETEASLNCPDLVKQYERSLIKKYDKLNKSTDKLKKEKVPKSSSEESFVIDKLELSSSNDAVDSVVQEVVGASRMNGEMMFLIQFKNSEPEYVPSKVANVEYPQEVIRFYEKCINWQSNK
jgi:hypothetical protein